MYTLRKITIPDSTVSVPFTACPSEHCWSIHKFQKQPLNSAEIATKLAASSYSDQDLVSPCVLVILRLEFDSKKLRSYIGLLTIISSEEDNSTTSLYKNQQQKR